MLTEAKRARNPLSGINLCGALNVNEQDGAGILVDEHDLDCILNGILGLGMTAILDFQDLQRDEHSFDSSEEEIAETERTFLEIWQIAKYHITSKPSYSGSSLRRKPQSSEVRLEKSPAVYRKPPVWIPAFVAVTNIVVT